MTCDDIDCTWIEKEWLLLWIDVGSLTDMFMGMLMI